ncbi:hypothetical protein QJS66_02330 [Kocuria rhizophila]|nr:hypothetical protein QJS66_02330 [Kocuria rhizophila]
MTYRSWCRSRPTDHAPPRSGHEPARRREEPSATRYSLADLETHGDRDAARSAPRPGAGTDSAAGGHHRTVDAPETLALFSRRTR